MAANDKDMAIVDATVGLVCALVGHDADKDTTRKYLNLAGDVLRDSASGYYSKDDNVDDDMSAVWKHLEDASSSEKATKVRELHGKLDQIFQETGHAPHTADRIVMVLSEQIHGASDSEPTREENSHTAEPSKSEIPQNGQNQETSRTEAPSARSDHQQNQPSEETQTMEQEPKYTQQQVLAAMEAEETNMLREFLFALQGIEGDQFRFYEHSSQQQEQIEYDKVVHYEGIRIRPSPLFNLKDPFLICRSRLGSGAMDAFRIIGEAGWLYKRVQSYIDKYKNTDSNSTASEGVVSQALAVAFSNELHDYEALIASFEAKLQASPLDFLLLQLLVDMQPPMVRLRTLAMLADGLSGFFGGQLLSALHKHTIHGDSRHRTLVQSMVQAASQPWFHMLYQWTMTGTLVDPHGEFFVVERQNIHHKYIWHDRYQINKARVPVGIIERDLVRPSLIVGKGINFIRSCLQDTEWTLVMHDDKESSSSSTTNDTADGSSVETRLGYHYVPPMARRRACPDGYYVSPLHRTLAHAAHQVNTHILQSLVENHHLIQHLWALKQFFFLGQGDFFTALMDGLHQEFASRDGITGIYRHTLMAIMEGALRSTNADALPPYTLDRLGVELLLLDENDDARYKFRPGRSDNSSDAGTESDNDEEDDKQEDEDDDVRSGWDIFMLKYEIPDPLTCIVHPKAMSMYKLVFQLLFRLKRVEYMLNATWRQSTALQHALFTYAQHIGINLSSNARYARATLLLRRISLARQSMLHFVGNLQSYLMFGVLEGGWKELVSNIKHAQTLDEIIEAHDSYLDTIVRKSLLRGAMGLLTSKRDLIDKDLATQLEYLMDLARTFCSLQERIFTDALHDVQRAAEKQKEAERRLEEGDWGFNSETEAIEEQTFYGLTDESIIQKVVRVSEEFDTTILKVLTGLDATVNSGGYNSPFVSPNSTPPSESGTTLLNGGDSRRQRATDEVDMDSLRFLTFQLDYSDYYSKRANSHR